MSYSSNPFTSIEERLDRIEQLLSGKPLPTSPINTEKNQRYVYGISGLANLLNCSKPTAQRLKDSGKIPFTQAGRKIVFNESKVLSALEKGGPDA